MAICSGFYVDLPIENGDFPVHYVIIYQRVCLFHRKNMKKLFKNG